MTKQIIKIGEINGKSGDSLYAAFTKVNANFDELYTKTTYSSISGSLIPSEDITYDLGSPTKQWRHLYVSENTIYVGGQALTVSPTGDVIVNGEVIATPGGRVVSVPGTSIGTLGDSAGDLAFSNGYIYYCIEDFGGTTYNVVHNLAQGFDADGVNSGYLVENTYQLPEVGWKVYYNGEVRTIDQVNSSGIPGFYVVFVDSLLTIPGQAVFSWGPASATNIWKRVAWSGDTW